MVEKRDPYRSYGEKLISLFARLLFTGRSYSLTELANILACSKPTVLRLVDDIRRSYAVEIEESFQGNRKYYRITKPSNGPPLVGMNEMEVNALWMCKSFAEHLLGSEQFEEATRAVLKTHALLPDCANEPSKHFATFKSGVIDYTPHQDTLRTLIEAMNQRCICKIVYKNIMASKAKTFFIKPLKIFSHHDAIYVHARYAREVGKTYQKPEYDPVLAIHRIVEAQITERMFTFPEHYDFERSFNKTFGMHKGEPFEVEVEFHGKPVEYVCERIWSQDQKIVRVGDNRIRLIFTASSRIEMIPWVLSFADFARVIRPEWLFIEVRETAQRIIDSYIDNI